MKRIVVSAISLLRRPAFLGSNDETIIVHTTACSVELAKKTAKDWPHRGFCNLIDRAISEYTIIVDEPIDLIVQRQADKSELFNEELSVVNLSLSLRDQHPSDEIVVSLQFDGAKEIARTLNLIAVAPNLVFFELRDAQKHPEIFKLAKSVRSYDLTFRFLGVFCMVALLALSGVILFHTGSTLSVQQTLLLGGSIPILAIILYWYRTHFRLNYGISEAVFGCLMVVSILTHSKNPMDLSQILQLLAATYVIVRGLDNIGQGASTKTWASTWERFFAPRTG